MPSQLYKNDKILFLACKPFTYRGKEYSLGDEFPQEEANNIETLVRSRFVIPFVETPQDKPRHWHKHVRTREQAEEKKASAGRHAAAQFFPGVHGLAAG